MSTQGLSVSSMQHVLNLTRRVLRFAMRCDLVVRNVAEPVQAPRGPKAERFGLTKTRRPRCQRFSCVSPS